MTQERIKHNLIEIARDPLEKLLMKVKQFLFKNRKWVLISIISLVALIIISIVAVVLVEHHIKKQKQHFEEIIMIYATSGQRENPEFVNLVVDELQQVLESSYFGTTTRKPYFIIGDVLYSVGDYERSAENLIKYADKSRSKVMASVSLQKAAIALEEAGDIDRALRVYERLLRRYSALPTYDEFLYNAARVYAINGDNSNSNRYFDMLRSAYPQSVFAERARQLQLLMNAGGFPPVRRE